MPAATKIRAFEREKKYRNFIVPMLAHTGGQPFSDPEWLFETKWDGYRAVAETGGKNMKLYSRNGLSFVHKYAEVAGALEKIKQRAVLDGEIVVLDHKSHPNFQLLQHYPDIEQPHTIVYYVFDILELGTKKLYDLPLTERKKILEKFLPNDRLIQYCGHLEHDGEKLFGTVIKKGLEGMMAKRKNSLYHTGRRTKDWLKIRNHKIDELIICGYSAPRGRRKYFGSLVLGIYHGKKLVYAGNVGTGFDEKSLQELHAKMEKIKQRTSPFDVPFKYITAITWVRPKLVCNIKYTEWTRDKLRHPVFIGLRTDKKASEVKLKK